MRIIDLYWSEGSELIQTECPKKDFEVQLNEYRKENEEDYNTNDFVEFMNKKGYKTEIITPEDEVYF